MSLSSAGVLTTSSNIVSGGTIAGSTITASGRLITDDTTEQHQPQMVHYKPMVYQLRKILLLEMM